MNKILLISEFVSRVKGGKGAVLFSANGHSLRVCLFSLILALYYTAHPFIARAGDMAPEIKMQTGHAFGVNAAAFSPDGKYAVTGAGDNTLKLWSLPAGKELRTFTGHSYSVDAVAFSPDGKYVISGSSDTTLILWDVSTGKPLRTFTGHAEGITSVAFSPDGRRVLSSSRDKLVKLWDVSTGKEVRTFAGHDEPVTCAVFSPDGRYVLSASYDKTLRLWNAADGRTAAVFTGHSDFIDTVAFSPDGRYAASGSWDRTVKVWDVSTGKETMSLEHDEDKADVLCFSHDGKYLVTGSERKTVRIWDIVKGREMLRHSGIDEKSRYTTLNHDIVSVSFSPDDKYVYSVSGNNDIQVMAKESGTIVSSISGITDEIEVIAVSPDSAYFVSGSFNKKIRVYDMSAGKISGTISGHTWAVLSLAFSPDGRYIVTGGGDNTVRLWETAGCKEVRVFTGHSSAVYAVRFSNDGRYILSGSGDKTLVLWDASDGRIVRTFPGDIDTVYSADFSPDSKYILSGSGDNTLKLWDAATGRGLRIFRGHSGRVFSARFSPDGRYALSGSGDNTLKLWDVASGKEVRTFTGHSGAVNSVMFSPDGKYAVSGSEDSTMKLWDIAGGKELGTFRGHSERINSVAFTGNGKFALSGSADGTVRVWNIGTGQWVVFASHRNGEDWLVYDSDGYWDSSRHGGDLVAMVRGMDCWNIDQFAVKNNRPDLVLSKLPGADMNLVAEYNRQYLKRARKLEKLCGINAADVSPDMHVPRAEILGTGRHGKNIDLSLRFTDSMYDIVSYNVYVNDVPLYTGIGRKVEGKKEFSAAESIELSAGDNKIEVSCFNARGAESYRALTHAFNGEKKRGSLYFIGFGVSDYADPSINDLRYAENDVHDLAKKFLGMKNEYDNVYVRVYTGRDVTPANIRAAAEFLKDAGVDDTVILFISGHGMHDSDEYRTYYYITQNAGLKNLRGTAADFETIEDILAGIKPRKKLFLMDTCDSGETDDMNVKGKAAFYDKSGGKGIPRTARGFVMEYEGNRAYFDRNRFIFNDLFRRTGAVVFSSSMGGEASWEFDSLRNGAFTEAILEGLSGKADADGDGSVTIDELRDYVHGAVNDYTEGRQHPVIDRDNIYIKLELPAR